mgnify:CR=1 FL=1
MDASGNKIGSELNLASTGYNRAVSGFSGGSFVAVSDSSNGLVGSVFESSFNAVTNFTTSGAYPSTPRVTTLSNRNYFVFLDGAEQQINGQLSD